MSLRTANKNSKGGFVAKSPGNPASASKTRPSEPPWAKLYEEADDRAIAKARWKLVIDEMERAQTLSPVNGPAIMRLVMFYVEYERAARSIAKSGVIRQAVRTKVPQVSPEWTVMKQAAAAAARVEEELGLTPRRRNNAGKVQQQAGKKRPSDAFDS
jgi:P27 family predicted phage terminase small subunit